jgi:hypothetical protein
VEVGEKLHCIPYHLTENVTGDVMGLSLVIVFRDHPSVVSPKACQPFALGGGDIAVVLALGDKQRRQFLSRWDRGDIKAA